LNPGKKVVEARDLPLDDLKYARGVGAFGAAVPAEELHFAPDELARAAFACTGCGSCRTVKETERMCPVFRARGVEEASPRAKLNLLRELSVGGVSLAHATEKVLDLCLWCRSCGRECPSGLSIPEAIIELRGRNVRAHGIAARARGAAALPDMARLGAVFPRVAGFFGKRAWVRALFQLLFGIDAGKPLPALARRRFSAQRVRGVPPVPPGKIGVALFADLYIDFFAPELGRLAIDVLERAGCAVVVPRQEPCGVVPLVYGKIDAARAIAARNEAALRPFVEAGYVVVSPEPTAAVVLRKDYPRLLGGELLVSARVFELGEFLYARWREGAFPLAVSAHAGTLAYHRPCHLRELEAPGFKELCREALGIEFAPLPESCCGLAGTFGMRRAHHELSAVIGAKTIAAVKAGKFDGVVSECASCRMQLAAEAGARVLHPLELFSARGAR
jgi:Fe-S oxidoreductase